MLIVSEQGVAALLAGGRWRVLRTAGRVPSTIHWAHPDNRGRCWLAGENGVSLLDGTTLKSWGAADGVPAKPLGHVWLDGKGRPWVCSWGDGVAFLEAGKWRKLTKNDGLLHPNCNGCAQDREGDVWVATEAGTTLFGADSRPVQQLRSPPVKSIAGNPEGWIALGVIGGLGVVAPGGRLHEIGEKDGLPQRTPQATFFDSRGRLWAGTWGGGLVQVDKAAGKVLRELALPAAGEVARIAEDARGVLWVASMRGLWKLAGTTWERVPLPRGVDKVRVVATVPPAIGRQLLTWAE